MGKEFYLHRGSTAPLEFAGVNPGRIFNMELTEEERNDGSFRFLKDLTREGSFYSHVSHPDPWNPCDASVISNIPTV